MGFLRSAAATTGLASDEVDAQVHAAQIRLLEYRGHEIAPDPRKHPAAAAAVAAEREAHAADFHARARQGGSAETRHALMLAAVAAVAELEAVFGPPPGRQPLVVQEATA